jgi:RecA-family ATPase
VRPWLDVNPTAEETTDAILIGHGNWLTRGSGLLIVGPTGSGKSTLDATLAFSFGLGREALGFQPTRPLKSIVIQAEDDDLDLARYGHGYRRTAGAL